MAPSLMEIAGNNSTRGSTRVSQFTKEVARHAWSRKTREVVQERGHGVVECILVLCP
jgi:hypothetical protein